MTPLSRWIGKHLRTRLGRFVLGIPIASALALYLWGQQHWGWP